MFRFDKTKSIAEIQKQFFDALREEQVRREVHILCLPLDLRIYILEFVENSSISLYRNRFLYRDFLSKDGLQELRKSVGSRAVLYALAVAASKRLANAFFAAGFLDRLSRYNFDYDRPLVICAEDLSENQITSVEGTSSGKFVLAILEENREFKVSPVLEDLVLQSNKIRVSAHAARLAKLNTQRYSHLESINLTIPGHTARPIWYLHDSKASEVVCL